MSRTSRILSALFLSFLVLGCISGKRNVDLRKCVRLGPEGARISLVVFSDFQCAFCLKAAREIKRLRTRYPARLKIYFKHFPLSYHPQALPAAHAAEAARRQGRFWQMHDMLFEHAGELNDDIYTTLAEELGLDMEKFAEDLDSFSVANRVAADRVEGESLGVDGTPFFLINRVPYYGSYADLEGQMDRR